MTPTAPLDQTHADSLEAKYRIRRQVTGLKLRVAAWTPRPCPKGWKP
jgi:hypothetical protein